MKVNEEEVRKIAHEIYLERIKNGWLGDAKQDWDFAVMRWIQFDFYRNQYSYLLKE